MTLFPRQFEADTWIDTSPWFSEATALLDVEDIMTASVADIIMSGKSAPSIVTLPEGATARKFGTFDSAAQFYDGDEPTYYMG